MVKNYSIDCSTGEKAPFFPENNLAYLEPLCTMPEYRKMGLASATLSELSRRTVKLGATHMTGGDNAFYTNLGYETVGYNEVWEKIKF